MSAEDKIIYLHAKLAKPVVFIGMMGVGKTTIGKRLAHILNLPFTDSDLEIEKEEGISVRDIFDQYGESRFRLLERQKIASLLSGQGIISVGGGAVTSPQTLADILAKSICVWLDAPLEILVARTSAQAGRPLLQGKDPAQVLKTRMAERKSFYESAHLKVDASATAEIVAQNALGQIYDYLINKG